MSTKTDRYKRLYEQLHELLSKSPSLDSILATINAVLYHKINTVFWVGFYFYRNEKLVVGPYQGPLACQELNYPNGACWHAVLNRKALIIPDVNKFSGHISCDSRSKSEIVIPIYTKNNEVFGVLDIDSDKFNAFDDEDLNGLIRIISLVNID